MNTRKYPRTMEEAFGPGHRGPITDPTDMPDKIVAYACGAAVAALVLILVVWG